ncbi:MAG: hypothetical protein IID17_03495 [Nitrospinae bacterium]|nr:hypothetical protein [Nitrospinota bacterium]
MLDFVTTEGFLTTVDLVFLTAEEDLLLTGFFTAVFFVGEDFLGTAVLFIFAEAFLALTVAFLGLPAFFAFDLTFTLALVLDADSPFFAVGFFAVVFFLTDLAFFGDTTFFFLVSGFFVTAFFLALLFLLTTPETSSINRFGIYGRYFKTQGEAPQAN